MTESQLRPRSVSEIVDAAFAMYRHDAGKYMVATAIGFAPVAILQLMMPTPDAILAQAETGPSLGMFSGLVLVSSLLSIVCYVVVGSFITVMGSRAYLGGEPDVGSALSTVFPRLFRIFVTTFLKVLIFVAIIGVTGFLTAIMAAFVGPALLLLVFPVVAAATFYVFARYFASEAAVLLEDSGAIAAMGRSTTLSDGRKWSIFLTLLLVLIVYWIIVLGVTLAAGLTGNRIISVLLSMGVNMVAFPILQLTFVALYYDARIRREGFDVEHMAASMDGTATARP